VLRCQVCFLLMVWLFSICIVPMAGAVSERHFLEVIDLSSNATILSLPLFLDETFTIRYIHSVDHSPVCEVFELDQEGRLTLQATYFKMFGAGMGHWQGRGYIDFDGQWTWFLYSACGVTIRRSFAFISRTRDTPQQEMGRQTSIRNCSKRVFRS
jgi:hypothetical protein